MLAGGAASPSADGQVLGKMVEPVIRAFDDMAPVYDTVLPFFARFGAELAAWLPPSTPGDRLLDLGAGIGATATPALERGYAVVAIDRSTAMVTRLKAGHPAIDARVMEAASVDFDDGSVDVVTAGSSCTCCRTRRRRSVKYGGSYDPVARSCSPSRVAYQASPPTASREKPSGL